MPATGISAGSRIAFAILASILFLTNAWAADDERVLHSFGSGNDGSTPIGGLISDGAGNLYGMTTQGGIHGDGTVFELSPREGGGWTEKVLHSFNGNDGFYPFGELIMDSAGNLYGTTGYGGIHCTENGGWGCGTVFELSPRDDGSWTETVLHNFGKNNDGVGPSGAVIMDAVGNLYGTAGGGIHGYGTVFELSPRDGSGWTETVLHSFDYNNGAYPVGALIMDTAGNLYGTTGSGGIHNDCADGCGTVFELSPREDGGWTETVLHSFGGTRDGATPLAAVIMDGAGNLYGTTSAGGIHCNGGCGTVFQLSPNLQGGWSETVLRSFGGTDGRFANGSLIMDPRGNLYGTTSNGGIHCTENGGSGCGTVFKLSPRQGGGWTETVLHSFGGTDGVDPIAVLVINPAGSLYGMTVAGGINYHGTIFELSPEH